MTISSDDRAIIQDMIKLHSLDEGSKPLSDGMKQHINWYVMSLVLGVLAIFGTAGYFVIESVSTRVATTTAEKTAQYALAPTVESSLQNNPGIVAAAIRGSELGDDFQSLLGLRDSMKGAVVVFTHGECKEPFEKYEGLDGRFVLATSDPTKIGEMGGTAFADAGTAPQLGVTLEVDNLPEHGHVVSALFRPNDLSTTGGGKTAVDKIGSAPDRVSGGTSGNQAREFTGTYGLLRSSHPGDGNRTVEGRLSEGGGNAENIGRNLGRVSEPGQRADIEFPYQKLWMCAFKGE
ncbi:hypothetical protein [Nisaea denitrificans]|uniref:hypothetical protein n=1 Tax=Nisaea denitrificans TaxID=390877 RepID=UPI0003F9273B|nr:hypothetical protein [Nisaea denitrificans]